MSKTYAIGLISALAAATSSSSAFSDDSSSYSPFSFLTNQSGKAHPPPNAPSSQPSMAGDKPPPPPPPPKVRNDNPRTSSAGFDPEALERGAEALRKISKSPNSKEVWIWDVLEMGSVCFCVSLPGSDVFLYVWYWQY